MATTTSEVQNASQSASNGSEVAQKEVNQQVIELSQTGVVNPASLPQPTAEPIVAIKQLEGELEAQQAEAKTLEEFDEEAAIEALFAEQPADELPESAEGVLLAQADTSSESAPAEAGEASAGGSAAGAGAMGAGQIGLLALGAVGIAAAADDSDSSSTPAESTDSETAGNTFTLTTNTDTFNPDAADPAANTTAGDDTIRQVTDGQLAAADVLDAGAGEDTLLIRDMTSDTGTFTSTNIEIIDARAIDNDRTVELDNATGYTTLVANGLTGDDNLTFDEITADNSLTFVVKDISFDGNSDASFDYTTSQLSGSGDSVTLDLSNITAASATTVSIDDDNAANALETLDIVSSADNTGGITLADDALQATTINISGAGDLDISAAALANATTVDAGSAGGDLTLQLGDNDVDVDGGTGDDFFDFAATTLDSGDSVTGGEGEDTLQIASAQAATAGGLTGSSAPAIDVENVWIDTAIGGDLDAANFGADTFIIADGSGGNTNSAAKTVSNLVDGSEVVLGGQTNGSNDLGLTVANSTAAGENDNSLTVNLADSGVFELGLAGLESLTVDTSTTAAYGGGDGARTIDIASSMADLETVTVTGSEDATFNVNLVKTIETVDASQLEGDLTVTIATGGDGVTITGGTGDDAVTGGDGVDSIQLGSGDDTVTVDEADAVNDTVNGGAGADTIKIANSVADGVVAKNTIDLNDLNASTLNDADAFDNFTGFENIDASLENNSDDNFKLVGDAGNNVLTGGDGADVLIGGAGDDTLDGHSGTNTFNVTGGNDTLLNIDTNDTLKVTGDGVATFVDSSIGFTAFSGASYGDTLGGVVEVSALAGEGIAPGITGFFETAADVLTKSTTNDTTDTGLATFGSVFTAINNVFNFINFSANAADDGSLLLSDGEKDFFLSFKADKAEVAFGEVGTSNVKVAAVGNSGIDVSAAEDWYSVVGTVLDATSAGGALDIGEDLSGIDSLTDASASVDASTIQVKGAGVMDGINWSSINAGLSSTNMADDAVIIGGDGNDTLTGGSNTQTIVGGAGADTLDGAGGSDTYRFAAGDVASGEKLTDTSGTTTVVATETVNFSNLDGTQANAVINEIDQILIESGETATFTGVQLGGLTAKINATGSGAATLDINVADGDSTADFSGLTGTAFSPNNAFDSGTDIIDIDVGAGTSGSTITGTNIADDITGGAGGDTIIGGAGANSIDLSKSGSAADTVQIGRSNSGGADVSLGSLGKDTVSGFGTSTDDVIAFDNGNITVSNTTPKIATLTNDGATLSSIANTATASDVDIVLIDGETADIAAAQTTLNASASTITDSTNGAIVGFEDAGGSTQLFYSDDISTGSGTTTALLELTNVAISDLEAANLDVLS